MITESGLEGQNVREADTRSIVIYAVAHAMKGGGPLVQSFAARCFGRLKTPEAALLLKGLLDDSDPDVRCDAIEALGRTGYGGAAQWIARLLDDEHPLVRVSAVQALWELRDPASVEPLIKCLRSSESFPYSLGELSGDYMLEIREAAAGALGELNDPRAVKALIEELKAEDSETMLGTILRALLRSGGGDGADAAIAYLGDESPYVRRKAAALLPCACEEKRPEVLDALREALTDGDNVVRLNAAEGIGGIGSERDTYSLVLLLKDNDTDVRLKAAGSIAAIGGRKGARHLHELLKDPVADLRGRAVELIASLEGAESVDRLTGMLDDASESVCSATVYALGSTGDERAARQLEAVCGNRNRGIALRTGALMALARIKSPASLGTFTDIINDAGEDMKMRLKAIELAAVFEEDAVVEALAPIASSPEEELRKALARLLGGFRGTESESLLLKLPEDASAAVRAEAAISLAHRGDDSELGFLELLMRRGNAELAPRICDAVGNIKTDAAERLLYDWTQNAHPHIRFAAVRALGTAGDCKAVEQLVKALGDTDREVRRAAVTALGSIKDKKALKPLVAALYDHDAFSSLRGDLAAAIARIDADEAARLLAGTLYDADMASERWVALEALASVI